MHRGDGIEEVLLLLSLVGCAKFDLTDYHEEGDKRTSELMHIIRVTLY